MGSSVTRFSEGRPGDGQSGCPDGSAQNRPKDRGVTCALTVNVSVALTRVVSLAAPKRSRYRSSMIRVDAVSKRFDRTVALDAVSFEVQRGEIFGLLGPNGAGKTTLIRTILDLIKPDSGRVELFGRAFQPDDRNRIGYLPEDRGLYPRQPVT